MIYAISAPEVGRVKIGYTSTGSPDARLSSMRTGSPCHLEVVAYTDGGRSLERTLHSILHYSRSDREWFVACDMTLAIIRGTFTTIDADALKRLEANKYPEPIFMTHARIDAFYRACNERLGRNSPEILAAVNAQDWNEAERLYGEMAN